MQNPKKIKKLEDLFIRRRELGDELSKVIEEIDDILSGGQKYSRPIKRWEPRITGRKIKKGWKKVTRSTSKELLIDRATKQGEDDAKNNTKPCYDCDSNFKSVFKKIYAVCDKWEGINIDYEN